MSADIVIHARWLEKSGVGDIVRHFQVRGFDVTGNESGSRYFHVREKPHPLQADIDKVNALMRPLSQRFPR
jgi:hypothetical protein